MSAIERIVAVAVGVLGAYAFQHWSFVTCSTNSWRRHVEFYEKRRRRRYERKLARAERAQP